MPASAQHFRHSDFVELSVDLLKSGYGVRFQTKGWSMYPTIRDGDVALALPVNRSPIRRGDIVLCFLPRGLIAHRVIAIKRDDAGNAIVFLLGDSSTQSPEPVNPRDVLGHVVAVERHGRRIDLTGRISRFLQQIRIGLFHCRQAIKKVIKGESS